MHLVVLLACGSETPVSRPTAPSQPPPVDAVAATPVAPPSPVQDVPPGVLPSPQMTHAEIAAVDHVRISGSMDSACEGAVRIDLVPTKPGSPIAVLQLRDGEMEFELLAPTGQDVNLTAICDIDRDGRLSPNDWLAQLLPLGEPTEDLVDIQLAWMPDMKPGHMALGVVTTNPEPVSDPSLRDPSAGDQ